MINSDTLYLFLMVMIMAIVTYLLRAFPFIVFAKNRPVPPMVHYLGKVVSPAAIAMLVVYCLKDIKIELNWTALPEIISAILVIGIHKIWRNSLLSIVLGTVVYMILVQNL